MPAILAAFALATLAACAGPERPEAMQGLDTSAAPPPATAPGGAPALTAAELEISRIAARNGDRDFIMIDKGPGRVVMFENGQPVFAGSALTGMSHADVMPPGLLSKPFSQHMPPEDKITPAGRFTVSEEEDPHYGPTLSVNEVSNNDWDIAIHRLWVGPPEERRPERLASSNGAEKHVTWGCIDVPPAIMSRLIQDLPDDEATPLYILPTNQTHVASFFPPRSPAAVASVKAE
jgi:hypothetical protein